VEASSEPKLEMAFKGDSFFGAGARVPVSLLAYKLQSLQELLYHVAAAVRDDRSARRGSWFNRYRDAVELTYVESHRSDLTVVVEVGRPSPPVLARDFDERGRSLDLLFGFGDAVQQGCRDFGGLDSEGIKSTIYCARSRNCCRTRRKITRSN